MFSLYSDYLATPLGLLEITASEDALQSCQFVSQRHNVPTQHALIQEACAQLIAYFDGTLCDFDLPLSPQGSVFRLRCWHALRQIPYGQTCCYGEQARAIGSPQSARAVGQANHHNPLGIIIPCHRVISRHAKLLGYRAGIEKKRWLLNHERRILQSCGSAFRTKRNH